MIETTDYETGAKYYTSDKMPHIRICTAQNEHNGKWGLLMLDESENAFRRAVYNNLCIGVYYPSEYAALRASYHHYKEYVLELVEFIVKAVAKIIVNAAPNLCAPPFKDGFITELKNNKLTIN